MVSIRGGKKSNRTNQASKPSKSAAPVQPRCRSDRLAAAWGRGHASTGSRHLFISLTAPRTPATTLAPTTPLRSALYSHNPSTANPQRQNRPLPLVRLHHPHRLSLHLAPLTRFQVNGFLLTLVSSVFNHFVTSPYLSVNDQMFNSLCLRNLGLWRSCFGIIARVYLNWVMWFIPDLLDYFMPIWRLNLVLMEYSLRHLLNQSESLSVVRFLQLFLGSQIH